MANDEMGYGRFIIRGSKKRIKMVGTRFRTLVKEPHRGHEIELSAPKFQIKQPKPRKARIWRSKKSAAMGDFWTKTERGKSWKRWTAEKEAYGARWGYYLMNGINIPYLNPEKFIERTGYRIIELRMKKSAVKDAVESKIEEIRIRGKGTAQKEKTENNTHEILGIRTTQNKISEDNAAHYTSAKTQDPQIDGEAEEHQFTNDEFYTLEYTFENRGWIPSAASLKLNPNTVDFTSEEIINHILIQIAFGMNTPTIEEELMNSAHNEQEIPLRRQLAAIATAKTKEEEPEDLAVAQEKTLRREKRTRRMRVKQGEIRTPSRLKIQRGLQANEAAQQSAKERRGVRKNYLATKKPQKRNNSAALLRRGVRVGVIRNQYLRLASAGVSLPPEKS